MKKVIRVLMGLMTIVACVSILAYTNRTQSVAASLPPIQMAVFDLPQGVTNTTELAKAIEKTPGVTACSINSVSQLITVTFHNQQNQQSLKAAITQLTQSNVQAHTFPAYNGKSCPIHKYPVLKWMLDYFS